MEGDNKFRFYITCVNLHFAVFYFFCALCLWAEKKPKTQTGCGGGEKGSWEMAQGKLTLRFTSAEYRNSFIKKAEEILHGRWKMIATNDNDPAIRQRPPH